MWIFIHYEYIVKFNLYNSHKKLNCTSYNSLKLKVYLDGTKIPQGWEEAWEGCVTHLYVSVVIQFMSKTRHITNVCNSPNTQVGCSENAFPT